VTARTSLPDESSQSPETSSAAQQTLASTRVSGRLHANELNHRQVSSVGRHEVPSQGKSVSSGEQTLVKLQILKQHKERGENFFKPLEQSIDGTWRWYQEARHLVIW